MRVCVKLENTKQKLITNMNKTTDNSEQRGAPLDAQRVGQAIMLMQRLRELQGKKIVERGNEAEVKLGNASLMNFAMSQLDELLGTWMVAHTEYNPLVQGVTALLRRVSGVNAQAMAQRKQAGASPAPTSEQGTPADDVPVGVPPQTPPENTIPVSFGEATKPGAPVE